MALGISSFGNPGTFTPANYDTTHQVVDPECGKDWGNGGTAIERRANAWSGCGYTYVPFANIIDPQKRLKFLAQTKFEVSDTMEVYGEFLWSKLETIYEGSPSYPPTNPGANYQLVCSVSNPGLADLMANDMTKSKLRRLLELAALYGGAVTRGPRPRGSVSSRASLNAFDGRGARRATFRAHRRFELRFVGNLFGSRF